MAQIDFGIGFKVDKTGLDQARAALEQISQLTRNEFAAMHPDLSTNEVKTQLTDIYNQANAVRDALSEAFNVKLNSINIDKFNQSLQSSGTSIQQVYNSFKQAGPLGENAFRTLANQVTSTNIQLKQTHTFLNNIATTLTNTIKWNLASSAVNAMTRSVQDAFNFTKALDSSLNDIRIVTNKSAADMDNFAVKANNAAKALGTTTTEYTNAALTFYQQGLDDQAVETRARLSNMVANVTGLSGDDAAEYVTSILNGYKVTADAAEEALDKLANVGANTASSLQELAQGMSKVAASANMLGVSEDELASYLSTILSVTRADPNSVGTALKTIFARISDIETGAEDAEVSLGEYSGAMAELGFNVLDSSGHLRDLGDVMAEIGAGWGNLSREQQVYLAQTMAGTRQYSNLVALFDNWDEAQRALNFSMTANGTLQQQQNIYMERTTTHVKELTAQMEELYMHMIDTDSMNNVIDAVTAVADGLDNFIQSLGGMSGTLKMLGSLGIMVFSDQIGKSLNTMINNTITARNNVAEVQKVIDNIHTIQGFPDLDGYTSQLMNLKENFYSLSKVMSPELFSQMKDQITGFVDELNRVGELNAVKQNMETFFEQINKINDGMNISFNLDNFEQNSEYFDARIDQLIVDLQNFKESLRSSFDMTNIDVSGFESLQSIQDLLSEASTDILGQAVGQDFTEYLKGFTNTEGIVNTTTLIEHLNELIKEQEQDMPGAAAALKDFIASLNASQDSTINLQELANSIEDTTRVFNDADSEAKMFNKALAEGESKAEAYSKQLKDMASSGKINQDQLGHMQELLDNYVKKLEEIKEKSKGGITGDLIVDLAKLEQITQAALVGVGTSFAKYAESMRTSINEQFGTLGNTIIDTIKRAEEQIKLSGQSMEQALANIARQEYIANMTRMAGAMTTLFNAFNSIRNFGNIWNNDDLTTGEKLFQTMTNLLTVVSSLGMGYTQLKRATEAITNTSKIMAGAKEIVTQKTEAEAKANVDAAKAQAEKNKQDSQGAVLNNADADSSKNDAIAKEGEALATNNAAAAQRGLNAAIKANPLMWLVIAIGAAVSALGLLSDHLERVAKARKEANDSIIEESKTLEDEAKAADSAVAAYRDAYEVYKETGTNKENLVTATQTLIDQYGIEINSLDLLAGNYKNINRELAENIKLKAQQSLTKAGEAADAAKENLETEMEGSGWFKTTPDIGIVSQISQSNEEYFKQLYESGLFTFVAGNNGDSYNSSIFDFDQLQNQISENGEVYKLEYDASDILEVYSLVTEILSEYGETLTDAEKEADALYQGLLSEKEEIEGLDYFSTYQDTQQARIDAATRVVIAESMLQRESGDFSDITTIQELEEEAVRLGEQVKETLKAEMGEDFALISEEFDYTGFARTMMGNLSSELKEVVQESEALDEIIKLIFPNEDDLNKALEQNGLTMSQFKERLAESFDINDLIALQGQDFNWEWATPKQIERAIIRMHAEAQEDLEAQTPVVIKAALESVSDKGDLSGLDEDELSSLQETLTALDGIGVRVGNQTESVHTLANAWEELQVALAGGTLATLNYLQDLNEKVLIDDADFNPEASRKALEERINATLSTHTSDNLYKAFRFEATPEQEQEIIDATQDAVEAAQEEVDKNPIEVRGNFEGDKLITPIQNNPEWVGNLPGRTNSTGLTRINSVPTPSPVVPPNSEDYYKAGEQAGEQWQQGYQDGQSNSVYKPNTTPSPDQAKIAGEEARQNYEIGFNTETGTTATPSTSIPGIPTEEEVVKAAEENAAVYVEKVEEAISEVEIPEPKPVIPPNDKIYEEADNALDQVRHGAVQARAEDRAALEEAIQRAAPMTAVEKARHELPQQLKEIGEAAASAYYEGLAEGLANAEDAWASDVPDEDAIAEAEEQGEAEGQAYDGGYQEGMSGPIPQQGPWYHPEEAHDAGVADAEAYLEGVEEVEEESEETPSPAATPDPNASYDAGYEDGKARAEGFADAYGDTEEIVAPQPSLGDQGIPVDIGAISQMTPLEQARHDASRDLAEYAREQAQMREAFEMTPTEKARHQASEEITEYLRLQEDIKKRNAEIDQAQNDALDDYEEQLATLHENIMSNKDEELSASQKQVQFDHDSLIIEQEAIEQFAQKKAEAYGGSIGQNEETGDWEITQDFDETIYGAEEAQEEVELLCDSLNDLQDQIDQDYDLDLDLAGADDILNTAESILSVGDAIAEAAGMIGEGFVVAADDAEKLAKIMPELFDASNIEEYTDEGIRLNQDMTNAILANKQAELDGDTTKTIGLIDNMITKLEGDEAAAQAELTLWTAVANGELQVETEKDGKKLSLEQQVQQAMADLGIQGIDAAEVLANAQVQGAEEAADGQMDAYQIIGQNSQIAFGAAAANSESAMNSMINNANDGIAAYNEYWQSVANGTGQQVGGTSNSYSGNAGSGYQTSAGKNGGGIDLSGSVSSIKDLASQGKLNAELKLAEAQSKLAQLRAMRARLANNQKNVAKAIGGAGKGDGSKGSGGSGGRGGSSNKDEEAEQIDLLEDESDIYHDIDIQIKQLNDDLKDLQRVEETFTGKDLIDNLNKQLDVMEKQRDTLAEKIEIAKQEADIYKDALETYGATFNADGEITNYFDILDAQLEKTNDVIERYNNLSAEQQTDEEKKKVEDAQQQYEDLLSIIEAYEKIINDTIPDLEDEIQEKLLDEIEIQIQKFNMEVELRLDMREAAEDWNEFKRKVIDDLDDDSLTGKAQEAFDNILSYYDTAGSGEGVIGSEMQHIQDILGELAKMDAGSHSDVYSAYDDTLGVWIDDRATAMEDLKNAYDELSEALEEVKDLEDEVHEAFLDSIDATKDAYDSQADQFEFVQDQLEHDIDLIEQLYGDDAYDRMAEFYDKQAQLAQQSVASRQQEVNYWKRLMDAEQEAVLNGAGDKEALAAYTENWQDALDQLNESIETWAEAMTETYKNTISGVIQELNNQITNGLGLDYVGEEFELMKDNMDDYLDAINSAYALDDLRNKWQDAINGTDDLAIQQQLSDMMQHQLDMLERKGELTQYDIDRAEKEYEIALKQIALQEAQQNKTKMRLRRDANGNYSYQFVSDEDEMRQAQQELAAAQNELYNFDKGAYQDNLNEMYSTWNEFQEKIADAYVTYADDQDALNEHIAMLQEQYQEKINRLTEQNLNIRNNLYSSAFDEMADLYDVDISNFENMTQQEKDLIMSDLIPTWEAGVQQMIDTFAGDGGFGPAVEEIFDQLDQAAQNYVDRMLEISDVNQQISEEAFNEMDQILDFSDQLIEAAQSEYEAIQDVLEQVRELAQAYAQAKEEAVSATTAAYSYWQQEQAKAAEASAKENANISAASTPTSGTASGSGSDTTTPAGDLTTASSGVEVPSSEAAQEQAAAAPQKIRVPKSGVHAAVAIQFWEGGNGNWGTGGTRRSRCNELGIDYNYAQHTFADKLNGGTKSKMLSKVKSLGANMSGINLNDFRYDNYKKNRDKYEMYRTGGYTGEWVGRDGKFAMLHQKELVLNEEDTSNILLAVEAMRNVTKTIDANVLNSMTSLLTGFGAYGGGFGSPSQTLDQNVHIDAHFPNVQNSREIEDAFNNLVNIASQRAFRNKRGS